jgi:hypothetical protein
LATTLVSKNASPAILVTRSDCRAGQSRLDGLEIVEHVGAGQGFSHQHDDLGRSDGNAVGNLTT